MEWVRALVSVFGQIPKLWDLQSSPSNTDLRSPSLLASTSCQKGKAVDRSNLELCNAWLAHDIQFEPQLMLGKDFTDLSTFQVASDSGETGAYQPQPQLNLASDDIARPGKHVPQVPDGRVYYNACSSSGPGVPTPDAPAFVPQPPTNAYPSATAEGPFQQTSFGPFFTASQGEGVSGQRSSPTPVPYQSSSDGHTHTIAGGHPQSLDFDAFDFSMFIEGLGATEDLPLPNAASTEVFEEATARLRDWGGSTHSLASASGSARARRASSWRAQWRRLVQEYKEVKEAQIDNLDTAAQHLRRWHSLFLEVEYRLESLGFLVSPEFQAQASRMFVVANFLTLIVIYRRRQLARLQY